MSPANKAKVAAAIKTNRKIVGGVYKRTRRDKKGVKHQRAEVRFDDIAGCLRTPAGGSSRQTILVIEGEKVQSRLLSPREAARLMGLDDGYRLPKRYNDAYHVAGDGVCVPVVRHLAQNLLEPVIGATATLEAARLKSRQELLGVSLCDVSSGGCCIGEEGYESLPDENTAIRDE